MAYLDRRHPVLEPAVVDEVRALLLADSFLAPLLRLGARGARVALARGVRARRAATQAALDALHAPDDVSLVERYTDCAKSCV